MRAIECLKRIVVIGTSGSGKTTLARNIAERLDTPHVELDAIHWGPDWSTAPREVFRERVAQTLAGDTWTVDGNYSTTRDIVWGRADTVVWLDYSWPVVVGRVTWRTIRRTLKREELWNGNRERFSQAFFSRDSIIWWAISTYQRRRKEYPILFSQPEYAHLHIVQLHSPRNANQWLASIGTANNGEVE